MCRVICVRLLSGFTNAAHTSWGCGRPAQWNSASSSSLCALWPTGNNFVLGGKRSFEQASWLPADGEQTSRVINVSRAPFWTYTWKKNNNIIISHMQCFAKSKDGNIILYFCLQLFWSVITHKRMAAVWWSDSYRETRSNKNRVNCSLLCSCA